MTTYTLFVDAGMATPRHTSSGPVFDVPCGTPMASYDDASRALAGLASGIHAWFVVRHEDGTTQVVNRRQY